ncbi:MAG: phytanoyl-CoA dioxygenase family protein [Pirellulales bacterium]|nr:phytanoyl-CoA dioxygenase family protein [Pirellulales bacterium]
MSWQDLSEKHAPVGDTFVVPAESQQERALKDEQLASFKADGFLAGVRLLDDSQVEQLRAEVAELADPSHPGHDLFYEYHSNESADPSTILFHALGAWRITPGLHDILWHAPVVAAASQLLGGAVRMWHDQLFCKPPKHGGVVAWHQDYSYWTRTTPMNHLTCWIALDDTTVESGCLRYIPGSHQWDLLPITGLAGDMDAIREVLSDEQIATFEQPRLVEVKAGEASFHHPLTIHGSEANRSDRPRRAVVLNFVRDGVRSASDEPLLEGVPVVPSGEPLGGQFFPLLYDPAANG